MKNSGLITLEGYLRARNISRAKLASMSHVCEKTIDRWISPRVRTHPAQVEKGPHLAKVRQVAKALAISPDNVLAMIKNGQKARDESENLRELRYAVALIECFGKQGPTIADEADLIRERLKRIRIAAKRVAAAIELPATT